MILRLPLAVLTLVAILPSSSPAQPPEDEGLRLDAVAPAAIRPDVRLVVAALIAKMRGVELPKLLPEAAFAPGAAEKIPEPRFRYRSFRPGAISVMSLAPSARSKGSLVLKATSRFEDDLGRRTHVLFGARYRITAKGVLIEGCSVSTYCPAWPRVQVYFVPAERVGGDFLKSNPSYGRILTFLAENALDAGRPSTVPTDARDYYVFACGMDRVAAGAAMEIRVAKSREGVAGKATGSASLDCDGWLVAVARGRFALRTQPELFIKVVYTPGRGTPAGARKARLLRWVSSLLPQPAPAAPTTRPATATTRPAPASPTTRPAPAIALPALPAPAPAPAPARIDYDKLAAQPGAADWPFVISVYRCVLHREPTGKELASGFEQLSAGRPRQRLLMQLFESKDYLLRRTSPAEFIRDVYQAVLGREPGRQESKILVDFLKKSTRATALNLVIATSEYKAIEAARGAGRL